MVQPFHHQLAELDGGLGAAEQGDLNDASVNRGRIVIALDIIAADHVEDDIAAFAAGRGLDLGDEVLRSCS